MAIIGLIAAMQTESAALLKLVQHPEQVGRRIWRFQTAHNDCRLIESGMGGVAAADAAKMLVEELGVRALVSFGIAGAVRSDLRIGDVIRVSQTCLLEGEKTGQFMPLATIPEIAVQAAGTALRQRNARLLTGTAVTTTGAQMLDEQGKSLENPILEMETHAIARIAHEKGIPFYALRSISDNPDAPIPIDLGAVMDDQFRFRFGKIIAEVIKHPGILKPGLTMLRNSRIACENAALALITVLEQASQ